MMPHPVRRCVGANHPKDVGANHPKDVGANLPKDVGANHYSPLLVKRWVLMALVLPGLLVSMPLSVPLSALVLGTTACAREGLEVIPLEVGGQRLKVEVARTQAEQARGLMYRTELGENQGMLFVYPAPTQVAYWMKNTFLPLSIAFIDSQKRIVNLADMAPNNETRTYPSAGPVQYVLEVNQGWFAKHSIKPGDVVSFDLPSKKGE